MMNDIKTREETISENIGLVHSCAKRFKGRGIEYDDLFGAGSVGLIKAVDKFDASKGFMFSTYAVPVILGEIKRLFRDGGSVKVSRSLKELSLKVNLETNKFTIKYGREPTITELSDILNVSSEKLVEALTSCITPMSLSTYDESNSSQIDIPIDAPEEKVCELLSLNQIIEELPTTEKDLIILRFFQNKTQSETAKILETTQVQISRREKKILLKLREKLL